MERYFIFLGGKNQNCENDYTTKSNLQIQCNPYQITNDIFHRTGTNILQFTWNCKRSQVAKAVLRRNNEARNQPSWLQIILQSYRHHDSMVLAQKQKYRPMVQDRKPRNKPMHLWVPYFWQRRQDYTMGQR